MPKASTNAQEGRVEKRMKIEPFRLKGNNVHGVKIVVEGESDKFVFGEPLATAAIDYFDRQPNEVPSVMSAAERRQVAKRMLAFSEHIDEKNHFVQELTGHGELCVDPHNALDMIFAASVLNKPIDWQALVVEHPGTEAAAEQADFVQDADPGDEAGFAEDDLATAGTIADLQPATEVPALIPPPPLPNSKKQPSIGVGKPADDGGISQADFVAELKGVRQESGIGTIPGYEEDK